MSVAPLSSLPSPPISPPSPPASPRALRICVVMPSFNHGHHIAEAIDSVLSQDYPLVDLLVMDGGSTDRTLEILRGYGDRLRYISQPDHGQADAINRGLSMVRGDIVCWLNSDDTFTPGALSRVADTFAAHPDVDFVYGKGWTTNEHGQILADSGVLPFDLWKLINQRNFIQQPSCFFRRSLLQHVGEIDPSLRYVMDWELWIRFGVCRGLFIAESLSCNRTYPQNKTQSGQLARWREIRRIVRRHSARRYPPVLGLYLIEAILQIMRTHWLTRRLELPLSRLFCWLMTLEMSGHYPADGGLRRRFHLCIGNPTGTGHLRLQLTPLSHVDPRRRGRRPIAVHWRCRNTTDAGRFHLREDGRPQRFVLRVSPTPPGSILEFDFRTAAAGQRLTRHGAPRRPRRIVAFLDDAQMVDATVPSPPS